MGVDLNRVTVLAYHAIGDCAAEQDHHNLFVTTAAFEEQMAFLARRRAVIALADAVEGRLPSGRPAVAITFDDGYRNVLRNAGPVLRSYGFPSTIFVPTAWRGRVNGWIEPSTCDLEIMRDDELRRCEATGIALESHGHEHIDMAATPPDEVRADIETSLDALEAVAGRRPRFLAYPFGSHAAWTPEVVRSTGLEAAFTIDELHGGTFAFERVQVTPYDGIRTFALKTTGRYLAVRRARAVSWAYERVKPAIRRVLEARRS